MTKSVYIVGAAGVGKSTFTGQLLKDLGAPGPLEDLHAKPNKKALVTLRGHRLGADGLYLGKLREHFPGTDGLDRASSPTGEEWLDQGKHAEFHYLVGEGATLSTRRFIEALQRNTELLLVHLVCQQRVWEERLEKRGANQQPHWLAGTVSRTNSLVLDMKKVGVVVLEVETSSLSDWEMALDLCWLHLR